MAAIKTQSIGEIIDEALGIKGPEDLLKMVLAGVGCAIVIVAMFMSTMDAFSLPWFTLAGFEVIALLLCAASGYVVLIVLPAQEDEVKRVKEIQEEVAEKSKQQ